MLVNKANHLICLCILAIFGSGCEQKHNLPIENGYEYAGHTEGLIDKKMWAGLQYRGSDGKVIGVWGYLILADPDIQITNNLAVFVGGVYDNGMQRFTDRLIAFEAPAGPPIDITEELLQKYSAKSGVQLSDIMPDSFTGLTKTNDLLRIELGIIKRNERGPGDMTTHDGTLMISWEVIKLIIQDVKKNGKLKTEKWSGIQYLQKE